MNKRELIEHINNTLFDNLRDTLFTEPIFSITESAKNNKVTLMFETEQGGVLLGGMLKKFEKVTIPQFVADWIEYFKNCKGTLYGSTNPFSYYGRAILEDFEGDCEEVLRWIRDNSDTYARAWLDGYTVEEKRYRVSLKNGQPLLKAFLGEALYFSQDIAIERYEVTRKQLEEAGFCWVFDCPGIEIEEVE